ncbi:RNA methyltransferase [Pelagibaculum spongiae]|uniref:tRNA (cytidine/uridine-2'-O-)-methyltransferase TrmJ n=1 Tax=Pelagibaculum spongiae TaxID=2080658 RepID=A0A2V1GMX1_9GAMM|nr:RNA methyltransferase [Pelagibaculum spongiae]PVZ62967.1 tRNA (cytosine(32)/uridine(32)-2'-O)-methyltransferase TrmJ [Pelagibaculum spongiae]
MSLSNIRIVLVQTWHSGNIGAAARAMKTMGLSDLWLVNPVDYPSDEATSRAAGAIDLLQNAHVVESLDQAVADCSLVIGTSAKQRDNKRPLIDAETSAGKLLQEQQNGPVALVFGRERSGLSNEDLARCNYHACVPANPEYPVLNMASAVQLFCYEICKQNRRPVPFNPAIQTTSISVNDQAYPQRQQLDHLHKRIDQLMDLTGFAPSDSHLQSAEKLQNLLERARPNHKELNLLQGFLESLKNHQDIKNQS